MSVLKNNCNFVKIISVILLIVFVFFGVNNVLAGHHPVVTSGASEDSVSPTLYKKIKLSDKKEGNRYLKGNVITIDFPVDGDIYVTSRLLSIKEKVIGNIGFIGQSLNIMGNVFGDIYSASESLFIKKEVVGDIGFFGKWLNIDAKIDGDIRFFGKKLLLNSEISGEVLFVGKSLVIEKDAVIQGNLLIEGLNLDVYGTIDGTIYGKSMDNITIYSGAKITGDVIHHNKENLIVSPEASIVGKTILEKRITKKEDFNWGGFILLIVSGLFAYLILGERWNKFVKRPFREWAKFIIIGIISSLVIWLSIMLFFWISALFVFSIILFLLWIFLILFSTFLVLPVILGALTQWLYARKMQVTLLSTILGALLLFILFWFIPEIGLILILLSFFLFFGKCVSYCNFYKNFKFSNLKMMKKEKVKKKEKKIK